MRFIVGDVFDVLATLDAGSVDLVVGSPPFLALRSYLPADHPDKAKEIGSEATPGEFLDTMLDVVEACDRVLAPHGSLVFELGDTYAGGGANEGLQTTRQGRDRPKSRGGLGADVARDVAGWPLDKSKVLVPQLFAIALAYGFNPLTGRETPRWRVRNTVAWCRPNPPVGRDGDKFRPATSFLTVATKARDRYWDGDAVRQHNHPERLNERAPLRKGTPGGTDERRVQAGETYSMSDWNPAGAPLLDYWVIPTAPYKGAHYATYPPDLVVPLVKAMCPSRVCRECGKPSTRITETTAEYDAVKNGRGGFDPETRRGNDSHIPAALRSNGRGGPTRQADTLGWSDCGHNSWRPGLVLDPFAGSGTTLAVASGHGLDAIGIDLDARNADLARERCGMFLEVVE